MLLARIPCLSSGLPLVNPSWPRSMTNQDGPPGVFARSAVGDRPAALEDGRGGRLQSPEVAAGLRLGGPVGEQDALLRDPAEPLLALDVRPADPDRVAAEERGQHRRGDPEVDPRHQLAHAVDVERAAAHPPVLLGDEQQLDAELRAAHLADQVERHHVPLVDVDQCLVAQLVAREIPDGRQGHLERVGIQSGGPGGHGRLPLPNMTPSFRRAWPPRRGETGVEPPDPDGTFGPFPGASYPPIG